LRASAAPRATEHPDVDHEAEHDQHDAHRLDPPVTVVNSFWAIA
jgi:hypothetical protein